MAGVLGRHLGVLFLAGCLAGVGQVQAQAPDQVGKPVVWGSDAEATGLWDWNRAVSKMVTFGALTNGWNLVMYGTLLGGSVASGPAYMAANAAVAAAGYYAHEIAWDWYGPAGQLEPSEIGAKTVTYRGVGLARDLVLGAAFGGNLAAAVGFSLASEITDSTFYITNEVIWELTEPRPAAP